MSTSKKKPIKFKRMADALFEQFGGSSGSEHLPSGSLSNLVNSYIEDVDEGSSANDGERDADGEEDLVDSSRDDERKERLKKLLGFGEDDDEVAEFRRNIIQEIDAIALQNQSGNISSRDFEFKRRLMVHLRQRGYNAGLCKSRWQKSGRQPGGSYEYIDIITTAGAGGSSRYMVEVHPAGQLDIARPTEGYTALLAEFPRIYVGKPEKLKQIVRLMSGAMKESLKSSALEVAPWRRNAYLQAQWFAPYKRTTNAGPAISTQADAKSRTTAVLGFAGELNLPAAQGLLYNCSRQFSRNGSITIGLLSAVFQGK